MRKILSILAAAFVLMASPVFAAEANSVDLGSAKANANTGSDVVNVPTPLLNGDIKGTATTLTNNFISKQIQDATRGNDAPEWLKRTDISVTIREDYKPVYAIETIQPIGAQSDRVTTFTQFRIGNDLGEGVTANLGFGKRFLTQDKNAMSGVNIFYDHAFKYGHARVGAGLEYFEGKNEYRANVYHAISGTKEVDSVNHIFERALSGYDAEVGTSLPNAPWAKLFVQGYTWDYKYADDMKGYVVRTEVQVTPQFYVELGYNHDNKGTSGNYAKVMYSIGKKTPAMFEDGKPVFRADDKVSVESKRLDKVKRHNEVEVERWAEVPDNNGGMLRVSMARNN